MIWTLLSICVGLYVLLRIVALIRDFFSKNTFPYRKHWALALAEPMIDAVGLQNFNNPDCVELAEAGQQIVRAGLLHYLELSPACSAFSSWTPTT